MIVATAGHVDHGKTLLVKMLTGMDTDRLEEEKRRGLSINLGFAYRKTGDNKTIAFVDVPGHMRFINNMIAGINGIDIGMLVVAADDGPMPQTREHMDVLRLLGVTRFVLVISKIDKVDKTRVESVRKAALALFPDSSKVPVFNVDTPAGKGISELGLYLEGEIANLEAKPGSGYFRLSIDRAFHIKGSGLVVSGTVASGSVQAGDSLVLLPQNISLRLRSLQMQEQDQQKASRGQRCALNISGDIEKDDIERGDWLVAAEISKTTTRFDARVSILEHADFGLKHMSPVKLYIGAKRISARLALLPEKHLAPGQTELAQLIVKRPIHCCHGDRFLLRDDSENETLGGGRVIDPRARVKNRSSSVRLQLLAGLEQKTAPQALAYLLFEQKQIVDLAQFFCSWNIRSDEEKAVLEQAGEGRNLKPLDIEGMRLVVATSFWQSVTEWVHGQLEIQGSTSSTGAKNDGLQRQEFQSGFNRQFPAIDSELVLKCMQSAGSVTLARDRISLCKQGQQVMPEAQKQLWEELEGYLLSCGLQVPVLADMAKHLGREKQVLMQLCKTARRLKLLTAVADNRFVLAAYVDHFAKVAMSLAGNQQHFSVAEFKNQCGIGRNLAVEVLEYFDKIGFTLRKESGRVVLDANRVKAITR